MTSGEKGDLNAWEAAYARIETPQEEMAKFTRRLLRLRAAEWPRDAAVVELFCGPGNGLHALSALGFANIEGGELSPLLVSQYKGSAQCRVMDCRRLPFPNESKDVLIVQGALHHRLTFPGDLEPTKTGEMLLHEAGRLCRDG